MVAGSKELARELDEARNPMDDIKSVRGRVLDLWNGAKRLKLSPEATKLIGEAHEKLDQAVEAQFQSQVPRGR